VWCLDPQLPAETIIEHLYTVPGISAALDRNTVCNLYRLPPDREADVAVIANVDVVLGAAAIDHDLSTLGNARLRSHGGVTESRVPFILNTPLNTAYRDRARLGNLRSRQLFEFAINGTQATQ
jgi:phosphonoacetate hydrolase